MDRPVEQITDLARRYILHGDNGNLDHAALAAACEALVREESLRSLNDALALGRRFYSRARKADRILSLAACRAMARVSHVSAKYKDAEKYYREIRTTVSDRATRARVDRALADVYMYLNRPKLARDRSRAAMTAFKKLGMHGDVAMTEVNYANLLHRQDRHREAETIYARAASYFEKQHDAVAQARCYYNRANTLVQLFDFDLAEQLYTRSEEIYRKKGIELEANDARYGIAWLRMLRGEFHIALLDLSACEQTYRRIGQPKGAALCELDRAEVYLGLNLFEDAWESASNAESQFGKLSLRYESSKAALFRARAAYASGNIREMRAALKKAQNGFASEKNHGFLGAVTLLTAQTTIDKQVARKELLRARRLFTQAQLPLWEGTCDLFAATLAKREALPLKRLESNRAVQVVPYLYAQWQVLLGDNCAEQGSLGLARLHWSRAADRLDSVRAQLPPIEFRAAFGQDIAAPHKKLIRAELPDRPAYAAVWSERFKTSGLWATSISLESSDPTRQRAEKSLIELANQAAHLWGGSASRDRKRGARRQSADSTLRHMQKHVRLALAAMEQNNRFAVDSAHNLLRSLQHVSAEIPVVQFHIGDSEIIAFVHEDGHTRACRYPDGPRTIDDLMLQWRFIMESQSLAQQFGERADVDAEKRLFETLGRWLWSPLEISRAHKRLLILPEGALANLPWAAVTVDNVPLCEQHQFVVSPSLRHFTYAGSHTSESAAIEFFAGTGDNLPKVKEELAELKRLAGSCASVHDPATRDDWPMTGATRIWHYAGHARLRSDNPFYSFLALHDGPLFAADFRLRRVTVDLVTLAACRTGEQVASPGEESSGLVRSLLEMGARNVLAGSWPVDDDSTALWMNSFYTEYLKSGALFNAATHAAATVREHYPSAYHWAAFTVFGAGK